MFRWVLWGVLWSITASAAPGAAGASQDVSLDLQESSWMSVDVSPDGRTIAFDILGDIFTVDSNGGEARPLITGDSFDTQPAFSPDGRHVGFVSDRSGSENIWISDADGQHPTPLSHDTLALYLQPSWASDGQHLYALRISDRSKLDAESRAQLWRVGTSGNGEPIPGRNEDAMSQLSSPSPSSDGRSLYYSARPDGASYAIYRRNLVAGQSQMIMTDATRPSGLMQPVISHDGRSIAYAVDIEGGTELRLRTFSTGADRRLAFPIERSHAQRRFFAYQGLLPRYGFTPNDRAIVIGYGGKLHRISLATDRDEIVPFRAKVEMRLQRAVRDHDDPLGALVHARVIQGVRFSPDERRIAFSAFGKVYVADVGKANPRRLTQTPLSAGDVSENEPVWSPDGKWIAYVTWSRAERGHVWRVAAGGGTPQRLTETTAFYHHPAYLPEGRSIVFLRVALPGKVADPGFFDNPRDRLAAQELMRMPAAGGAQTVIANIEGNPAQGISTWDRGHLELRSKGTALFVHTGFGLMQTSAAGDLPRRILRITARKPVSPATVDDMAVSPDGKWAVVQQNFQLFLLPMPSALGPDIVLALEDNATHARPITGIGADEFGWTANGNAVFWTVGATVYRVSLSELLEDRQRTGSCREDAFASWKVDVTMPRQIPAGSFVLRGARVATMKDNAAAAAADIWIEHDSIRAVGPPGSLKVPADVPIIKAAGKTITPGFVDTHAHSFDSGRRVIELANWEHPAALAYGVTTSLDPQSYTPDLFVYQDLIDAGVIKGPRAYTTGPRVVQWDNLDSEAKARCILTRYQRDYRSGAIKSYAVGNRAQRKFLADAARSLGLMSVTENFGTPRDAITQIIDGFSTNEHASDAIDYHDDLVQLYARSQTGYSPTLLIGGDAGPPAIDYFLARYDILEDAKLNRFTPRSAMLGRVQEVRWQPDGAYIFRTLAASAARIYRAGGKVGIGSHGEILGIGYQWEMKAMASGGLSAAEVFRMATFSSARVVGREAAVGTLEPGKLADLLIFDSNPLESLDDLRSLAYVIKNGTIYDAHDLEEKMPAEIH